MDSIQKILIQIEQEIENCMPGKITPDWMKEATGGKTDVHDLLQIESFIQPGRVLLHRGGKRWRPLVLVLTCQALGGGNKGFSLVPLVEIPHNASLIVDDIEDKSDERRGEPAIHKIYGDDIAINTGNLMYFLPSYIIQENKEWDNSFKNRLYSGFLEDLRRLHFGQGLDIYWHNQQDFIPEEKDYLQMCRYKTGSLARMAGRFGAIAANQNDDIVLEIAEIWENIGVGFQILDDVKNLTTGIPGKIKGDDIIEGKRSLPVIYHCKKIKNKMKLVPLLGSPEAEDIDKAIIMMKESGSIQKARSKGVELLEENKNKLEEIYPPSDALYSLTGIIETFINKMA